MTTDNPLAAIDARDRHDVMHLRDFWNRKRAEIEASGDTIRQKLLREHDDREARRNERAA